MIPVVTAAGVGQRGQGTFQLLSIGDDEFALFEVS
jgi:hypothetical protein